MKPEDLMVKRFAELEQARQSQFKDGQGFFDPIKWSSWTTSVLNLLQGAFGHSSVHVERLRSWMSSDAPQHQILTAIQGIFVAGKEDYEGGYVFNLQAACGR
jgi:hypothetical protein